MAKETTQARVPVNARLKIFVLMVTLESSTKKFTHYFDVRAQQVDITNFQVVQ
jgi:hypothetical protein